MNDWFYLPIGIVAAVLIYLFVFRKKKVVAHTSAPGIVIPANLVGHPRTDGGMWYTVSQVPEALRPIIGQRIIVGLADMIAATQYHNPTWTRYMNTADFPVFFIAPMATNMDGSPALLVGGVQSAGTVIGIDGTSLNVEPQIVLPEQAEWNYLDYLQTSVHNEGEHARERTNDYGIFLHFTGPADIHPHWTLPPVGGEAA